MYECLNNGPNFYPLLILEETKVKSSLAYLLAYTLKKT
ncbi:hypothetical protein NEOC65_002000 [Neochlamydia sp. AcF65]|nr:hypothetical protein [Neochlamydia sp. AcF65]MBS4170604.1 hypothetical protein [Neochlamydia sp. AcF95]